MNGTTAVIPARAGSKGAPGKNTRLLAGRPLWRHAVEQARGAGVSRVIVTTDIEEILATPPEPGLTLHRRPAHLARDDTAMGPVLMDLLADPALEGQRIVLLQPTSPLRDAVDIREALAVFESGDFDLVMSVTETGNGVLKYGRMDGARFVPLADPAFCFTNRQSLPPVMRPNGAVYVFGRDWFLGNGGFASDRMGATIMPPERSFDIDTHADFDAAEDMLARR